MNKMARKKSELQMYKKKAVTCLAYDLLLSYSSLGISFLTFLVF